MYKEEIIKLDDMLAEVMQQLQKVTLSEGKDKKCYDDIPLIAADLTEVRHIVADMCYRARSI